MLQLLMIAPVPSSSHHHRVIPTSATMVVYAITHIPELSVNAEMTCLKVPAVKEPLDPLMETVMPGINPCQLVPP